MTKRLYVFVSTLAVAVLVLAATSEASHPFGRSRPPSMISGTVDLNGCAIRPSALVIEAERVEISLAGAPRERNRRKRDRSRRAYVWRTRDAHVARFAIRGLDPNGIYRLRIGAPPNPCGKVFWRGPFEGFVVPGERSVRIEGFAARTEVEVFDEVADTWVAAAALDFDTNAVAGTSKRFRWRSSVPGAVGGELQIAARAFPTQGDFDSCAEPDSGLIERIPVPITRGGWSELPPLDFAALLFPDGEPPGDGGVIFDPPPGGDFSLDLATPEVAMPPSEAEQLATLRDIARGAPLYIRVVPRTAAGPACAIREQGVHGWALVARLSNFDEIEIPTEPPPPRALSAGDGHVYFPPFTGGERQGVPTYGQVAYKIIGEHTLPPAPCHGLAGLIYGRDVLGCAAIDAGATPGSRIEAGAAIEPGMWFYFTPRSSGGGGGGLSLSTITNAITGLATGLYTAAGFAIDNLSKVYEEIKTAVKDVALDAILFLPGLNDLCNVDGVDCETLVEIGLNTGLAAVGLPPSLPNFDELKAQGVEYLASQIQSQTGVPPYLSEQALAVATKALEDMGARRGGSDPNTNWVVPYLGFDPAYAEIVIRKNDASTLPDNLVLSRDKSELYLGSVMPIPRVFPASGELRVPMVLQPSLADIPAPLCRSDFGGITCEGIFPPGFAPVCRQRTWDPDTKSWILKTVDCGTFFGPFSPPAIYYRDQWIARKLDTTGCSIVGASTRLAGLFNMFLSPPPEELELGTTGFVQPRQPFSWSGWIGSGC